MKLGSLYQRAFKRLEPDDGKLSCPVLRGRRRWKLLLCYPTLIFLLLQPVMGLQDVRSVFRDLQAVEVFQKHSEHACALKTEADVIIKERRKALLSETPHDTDLFVFVSSSLHKDHLLQLGREAKKYRGVLVLKGLIEDSFRTTLKNLSYLFEEDVGVLIDPHLFESYTIIQVPTFVLTDGQASDVITGSVSLPYALAQFSERGELSSDAKRRMTP